MSKRHSDALAISKGAVNISGMAHSLVKACKECIDSNVQMREDDAVRLIVSQIAYIAGIWDGVSDWKAGTNDFGTATRNCEAVEAAAAIVAHVSNTEGDA